MLSVPCCSAGVGTRKTAALLACLCFTLLVTGIKKLDMNSPNEERKQYQSVGIFSPGGWDLANLIRSSQIQLDYPAHANWLCLRTYKEIET